MFPLNWNIPFIRKNGSRTTLGAITGDIAGIEEDIDDLTEKTDSLFDNMMDNGAVNVLHCSATSQSKHGIEFTVNDDETITANNTATTTDYLTLVRNADNWYIGPGTWKLTGCPNGGNGAFSLKLYSGSGVVLGEDTGSGLEFTLTERTKILLQLTYTSGYAFSNTKFQPMISLASLSLSYDDYVPYAMSNRKLTEDGPAIKTISLADYIALEPGISIYNSQMRKIGSGYEIEATLQGPIVVGRNNLGTMSPIISEQRNMLVFGSGRILDDSNVYHPITVALHNSNGNLSVYSDNTTNLTNGYISFSLFIPS